MTMRERADLCVVGSMVGKKEEEIQASWGVYWMGAGM